MKKVFLLALLGMSVMSTAYADSPASKQYVDQVFGVIQQEITAIQMQHLNLRNI